MFVGRNPEGERLYHLDDEPISSHGSPSTSLSLLREGATLPEESGSRFSRSPSFPPRRPSSSRAQRPAYLKRGESQTGIPLRARASSSSSQTPSFSPKSVSSGQPSPTPNKPFCPVDPSPYHDVDTEAYIKARFQKHFEYCNPSGQQISRPSFSGVLGFTYPSQINFSENYAPPMQGIRARMDFPQEGVHILSRGDLQYQPEFPPAQALTEGQRPHVLTCQETHTR